MKKGDIEGLRKSALDLLGKQLGGKAEIVSEDSDTLASKESVFRFVVRPGDQPNGPQTTLVLDAAGAPVDLAKLSAAEGRRFFATPELAVELPKALLGKLVTTNPKVDDIQLGECPVREKIEVLIPAQPIRQQVDVYFLADNTGSMGGAIGSVQTGANSIMSAVRAAVPDSWFGVGNYRDFKDSIWPATLPAFQPQLAINPSTAAAATAIGAWFADEGGDTPEAQLYALQQVAQHNLVGWRPNALKFVVWFGDAPGHEPICPAVWGGGTNIDRNSAIAALKSWGIAIQPDGIAVLGVSITSGPGLDAASFGAYPGCPSTGPAGQATAITTATHGSLTSGVNPGAVATAILNALLQAIQIHSVSLVPIGAIAPFVTSITPASQGPFDPTKPHTVPFDVVFERGAERCALRDQVYTGAIDVVIDHVVVAQKPTKITIPKCRYHYVAKFVCGCNEAPAEGCSPLRAGRYATEINIYNGHCSEALIEKRVTPVVLKGEPIGREPRVARELAQDRIKLPPRSATMDDCCRLAELLKQPVTLNGPLTVGFLEIVSDVPLTVTAVYTASGLKDDAVSIDVEQIHEVRK
ncbi:MAG TPA: hypothetical protein VIH93_00825 [Thermoanaerobaculia bacterium]|jgi:hypothetical protein